MKKITLGQWIFLALLFGLLAGWLAPEWAVQLKPVRGLFLNGIKCLIAPLLFSTIVTGINQAGNPKELGRTGFKAIVWFEIATTIALAIGLGLVNWIKPGIGVTLTSTIGEKVAEAAARKVTFGSFIEHLLPVNIVDAIARGDVLQLVIFSSLFGVALMLAGHRARPVLDFVDGLAETMFKFTGLIMKLAPLGVGAAMAVSVAEHGLAVLLPLLKLVGTLYFALAVFVVVVLLPALYFSGVKIKAFIQELRPSILLAFVTTASESAYPQTLQSLEKMGVPRKVSSLVLPLGYSFNLDGSTLYLGVASIFIAQAAGVSMPLESQLAMMALLMATTKGIAAVPRASLVVLSGALTTFNLPLEGIGLILGVDELMDMARTAVNLVGNAVATLVVSKWEGHPLRPEFSRLPLKSAHANSETSSI